MFQVFDWDTDTYLFRTDSIHLIQSESTHRNQRLIGISETQYLDVWPGGRRVLAERKILTPGTKELAEKLYKKEPLSP